MKEKNQKPKTKMILKANIKLCPEVQEKIDKKTKTACYIILGMLMIGFIYLLLTTFSILPTETVTPPTKEEIQEYCTHKNMLPDGYTISYTEATWLWIFKDKSKEQAYINCKAKYPKEITETNPTNPECCYPSNCPQASNNPKYCNCIYLIYCIKKGNEYTQWTYKIRGDE